MYIHRVAVLCVPPSEDLAARRAGLARGAESMPRRLGRFGLLTLLGADACVGSDPLSPRCGVYLATESGNASDTEAVLGQVVAENSLPKPVNFIHTLSNTAAFYVAQRFGLQGPNHTVSSRALSFERVLALAASDLATRRAPQALIGAVDEASRTDNPLAREASCWLLASERPDGALGRIEARSEGWSAAQALEQLPASATKASMVALGPLVAQDETHWWRERLPGACLSSDLTAAGVCDASVAIAIGRLLLGALGVVCMLHVSRDTLGRYVLLLVRRL